MILILDQLSPFSFLEKEEKLSLFNNARRVNFHAMVIICDVTDTSYDFLYILVKGKASVWINNNLKGYIEAPSYFGELAVLFEQPRSTRVVAETDVTCLLIPGKYIRNLLQKNSSFKYGFASVLKNKQRMFNDYDIFLASLIEKKRRMTFSIRELLPLYSQLNPILHPGCNSSEIDFPALAYVIRKLNFHVTSVNTIFLTEDLPAIYHEIRKKLLSKQGPSKKRSYEIVPGKILVLQRDDISDFIDITTKLCLYLMESKKIYQRIIKSESAVAALSKYYFSKKTINKAEISNVLPFNKAEISALKSIFGNNIYKRIYEIVAQQGDITIQVSSEPVRYYAIAPEMWVNEIRKTLYKHFHDDILESPVKIHIISSNVHSVRNCLSPWLHDNREEVLEWGSKNIRTWSQTLDSENLLYAIASLYFNKYPQKNIERDLYDDKFGVYHFDDTFMTGINVTLIDVRKLDNRYDVSLGKATDGENIIVNINYAYGRQARTIMQSLMLLFNEKIASISIFGKAGGMVGSRGDIILPDQILLQENDVLYPTFYSDISKKDFSALGWKKNIHHGGLLTVQGTLTQNLNLLKYYKLFWNMTAIEMESGHYIQEISSAKNYGLLNKNIITRFIYYLSDLPLSAHENLTVRMKMEEGLATVYTITRCVLKKILASNSD